MKNIEMQSVDVFWVLNIWFMINPDNFVVVMLVLLITAASILCIYISVGEIFTAYGNRAAEKKKLQRRSKYSSKDYPIDDIVEMAEKNNIIEVAIKVDGSIAQIGASSDCKNQDSKFFDKFYYVDNSEFKSIEDFRSALVTLSKNGYISVVLIDGIRMR